MIKHGRKAFIVILAIWWSSLTFGAHAFAGNACEGEMIAASKRYNIPLGILYAVGLTETGNKDSLQPYALNIDGKAVFPKTESAALSIFYEAKRRGAKLIDVGCMQINHYYHGERFPSVAAMFVPHINVDYAARFLRELRQREGSWTMAVARYHAGPNNDPAQKRYVCQVMVNMIASGFGKWTQASRQFCNGAY